MQESREINPLDVDVDPGLLDEARALLDELHASGSYPALQVCIRRHGQIVLHEALGEYRPIDDQSRWRPAGLDTRFLHFSLSKCVTAICLHILFDREVLHVDDRVHWHLPEFGQGGKKHITFRHLLTHSAGIPMLFWNLSDDLVRDWDRIIGDICRQDVAYFPGRRASYHILSSGFIIGEVIRRVDGRDMRTFLREELLEPLGFETFNYGIEPDKRHLAACVERVDEMPPRVLTDLISRVIDVDVVEALGIINRPAIYDSIIPSGNIVASAEETSRFFQMLLDGGQLDGTRILSAEQVMRATGEQSTRTDLVLGLTKQRYSLGFMLGRKNTELNFFGKKTEQTFGHLGFSRLLGWADRATDVAGAFLTSGAPVRPGREVLLLRRFQNKIRQACVG